MSATVVRKLEKIHTKASAPKKEAKQKGPPLCAHSGKGYNDLTHSERLNRNFVCGDCGTRFTIDAKEAKADSVVVPKHQIPADLHAFRKTLESRGG